MSILAKSSILVCLLCLCYAATPYSDCGSVSGTIKSLSVSGCDGLSKCILKKNTNVTLNVEFLSKVTSASATAIVKGVIGGVPLPFNFPKPNACEDSGISCPIKPNSDNFYTASLPIKGVYPPVNVDILFVVKDEKQNNLFCARIPSKIED